MRILTLLALLIAIAAVTFALQNSAPVAVQFLGWRSLDLSMGLILLITFSFGVLFGFVVSLFPAIKNMRKRSELMRKIEQQTYENEELNRQLTEATHQLQALQSVQPQHYLPEDASSNYPSDTSIH
ncbi:lipopolysaccharide assembly LapA domain-containing protein [Pelatocladus sp. BLCC-F211]|uniref:LapA family protein n=1 Tax=Pelatocladus sp. BLCC-F211 TaxID=3342752 RepID=UPI0035BADD90